MVRREVSALNQIDWLHVLMRLNAKRVMYIKFDLKKKRDKESVARKRKTGLVKRGSEAVDYQESTLFCNASLYNETNVMVIRTARIYIYIYIYAAEF